ncbi:MAG: hypothetical protein ACNYPG_04070 [Candidatus Porifericomitaceae bacterium WSBS_2022_MAG_OTU9]
MRTSFAFCALAMLCMLVAVAAPADDHIYSTHIDGDFDTVHNLLRRELDAERFFVVKDLNIGRNLEHFAQKWGDNYNRHNFSRIHTMIICNAWFANETINISPAHMSLCPLSLVLLHKNNKTMLHYALRQPMASQGDIAELMERLDQRFVDVLDGAVKRIRLQLAEQPDSGG